MLRTCANGPASRPSPLDWSESTTFVEMFGSYMSLMSPSNFSDRSVARTGVFGHLFTRLHLRTQELILLSLTLLNDTETGWSFSIRSLRTSPATDVKNSISLAYSVAMLCQMSIVLYLCADKLVDFRVSIDQGRERIMSKRKVEMKSYTCLECYVPYNFDATSDLESVRHPIVCQTNVSAGTELAIKKD